MTYVPLLHDKRGAPPLPPSELAERGTELYRQLMRQSKCMISGYQSLIRIALGWYTAERTTRKDANV
jgi:hypothetical protein